MLPLHRIAAGPGSKILGQYKLITNKTKTTQQRVRKYSDFPPKKTKEGSLETIKPQPIENALNLKDIQKVESRLKKLESQITQIEGDKGTPTSKKNKKKVSPDLLKAAFQSVESENKTALKEKASQALKENFKNKLDLHSIEGDFIDLLDEYSQENDLEPDVPILLEALYNDYLTIRQEDPKKCEQLVCRVIQHAGPSLPYHSYYHPAQTQVFLWMIEQMRARNFSHPDDLKILKICLDKKLLKLMPYAEDQQRTLSLLNELEKHPKIPENIKKQINLLSNKDVLTTLNSFYKAKENYCNTSSNELLTKMQSYEDLKKSLIKLADIKYPGIEWYIDQFKNSETTFNQILKDCREAVIKLDKGEDINLQNIASKFFLYDYLMHIKRLDLVEKLLEKLVFFQFELDPTSITDKISYALFASKLQIPERDKLKGLCRMFPCLALIKVLNHLSLEDSANLQHVISNLKANAIPIFEKYLALCLKTEFNPKDIIEKVAELKSGESILIPSGYENISSESGHAACLLITKTDKTYRLILFNTGSGLSDWHNRWTQSKSPPIKKNEVSYQTGWEIDQIPKSSLLDRENWWSLNNARISSSMGKTYVCLRDKLGKGGVAPPPSSHKEDYEQPQKGGTCATQSLMSFLRHFIMENTEGTPAEKEAVYKIIKAKLFLAYSKQIDSSISDFMKKHMQPALAKASAELVLMQIAQDTERYEAAINKFAGVLKTLDGKVSKDKFEEALKAVDLGLQDTYVQETKNFSEQFEEILRSDSGSVLSRYWILRAASNLLTQADIEAMPPENEEAFQLAVAKFKAMKYAHTI